MKKSRTRKGTGLPHYQIQLRIYDEEDARWSWTIVDMWMGGVGVASGKGYELPDEAAADAFEKLSKLGVKCFDHR